MRLFITFTAFTMCLTLVAQTSSSRNWVDSEIKYSVSQGNTIKVTNSLPRGGEVYTNSAGETYSYVIFWHKVSNEAETPIHLKLNFPPKSFTIFPSPDSHIRIYLPTEIMTSEKINLFNYGLLNLKDFLDSEFYEPSLMEKTINPKEEYFFYTSVLIYQQQGTARAGLIKEGNDLFYQLKIGENATLIPCGQIDFQE
ncbi:MAG: hypothetical protein R2786_04230 [Flavobacteriaceae bacterium]